MSGVGTHTCPKRGANPVHHNRLWVVCGERAGERRCIVLRACSLSNNRLVSYSLPRSPDWWSTRERVVNPPCLPSLESARMSRPVGGPTASPNPFAGGSTTSSSSNLHRRTNSNVQPLPSPQLTRTLSAQSRERPAASLKTTFSSNSHSSLSHPVRSLSSIFTGRMIDFISSHL